MALFSLYAQDPNDTNYPVVKYWTDPGGTPPITVVYYPVENYAPVPASDQVELTFYVGEKNQYVLQCIDPDCFIFSQAYNLNGQTPATTHVPWNTPGMAPRDDMSVLCWKDPFSLYWEFPIGPWSSITFGSIVSSSSGLISYVPQFERYHDKLILCSDSRGGMAYIEVDIFCVSRDERSNHPPIILGRPSQPVTMVEGQEFMLHTPNFSVADPDGDEIYASCNVGTLGRDSQGNFIWEFQSNSRGTYIVEILFFDIRGGEAIMEFPVEVKPWWNYPSAFLP